MPTWPKRAHYAPGKAQATSWAANDPEESLYATASMIQELPFGDPLAMLALSSGGRTANEDWPTMGLERSEHIRPPRVVNPRAAEFIQVLGAPVLALVGGDGFPDGARPRQKKASHGS